MRLRDKSVELIILIIMVPALGWLLKIAWDLESRTAALEARVARFVETTSEIRVGIAAAAVVNQPFRSAVIVFQPVRQEKDSRINVEIWDTIDGGQYRTYTAKLDTRQKKLFDVSLITIIKKADLDALNFRQMQEMARIVGLGERRLPKRISLDDSFVINAGPEEIERELKSFGFEMISTRSAQGVQTWSALREALASRYREN